MGEQQPTKEKVSVFKDIILPVVLALVIVVVLRTFVVGMYYVPSGSMIPTLLIDDKIVVTKFTYNLSEPERGDIVVFKYPPNEEQDIKEVDYIKRLIGLPGETLEIKNNQVYIDDVALEENYISSDTNMPDYGPIEIPEGNYFVMGDNRNHSSDSRVWGFVAEEYMIGKAQVRYWPVDRLGGLY